MHSLSNIETIELEHLGKSNIDFAIKTMEEIEAIKNADELRPHRHNFYTIIWAKKAKGTHFIDFKHYEFKDNIMFFVSPMQIHFVETEANPKGYVLLFSADFLNRNGISEQMLNNYTLFFNCDEVEPIFPNFEIIPKLENIMENICSEYSNKNEYSESAIASWLKLLFILCSRQKLAQNDIVNPELKRIGYIIKKFKDAVELSYKKQHLVSDYADKLNVTAGHLNDLIRKELGISAKQFIQNRIVLEAKRLATYSDLTSKQIAYELGFEDPAHFSKFFKKATNGNFSTYKSAILEKYN